MRFKKNTWKQPPSPGYCTVRSKKVDSSHERSALLEGRPGVCSRKMDWSAPLQGQEGIVCEGVLWVFRVHCVPGISGVAGEAASGLELRICRRQ